MCQHTDPGMTLKHRELIHPGRVATLSDMGASVSAIPFTLYQEIMNDIAPAEIEDIYVTIKLANRDTITSLEIVRDVEVLCGKNKIPY